MLRFSLLIAVVFVAAASPARADDAPVPSYHRHVTALFGRLGCNGGTCHGSVKGQNGFQLSLFGADSVSDHVRLLRDHGSRRLNFLVPEQSLLLMKGAGQIPHGGGSRFRVDSMEYELLRNWIASGAVADDPARSQLKELKVVPQSFRASLGETCDLKVEATFADGATENVTRYCSFESFDRSVATISLSGVVKAVGTGDAGLLVRYRDQPASARVLVPHVGSVVSKEMPAHNFIDIHILATLKQLNLPPAETCDDATFLRRVHLDIAGQLPAPQAVREFLDNNSPEKRAAVIEQLLVSTGHFDLWAMKFCDLLKGADFGVYADAFSKEHDAPRMQAWIRARLAENIPYDEFAERILTATSREGRSMEEYASEVVSLFEGYAPGRPDLDLYARRKTLDLFWQRRGSDGVKGAMQVAHAFLGLRLECAQCHRHPNDNWQQDDLLDFANLFMRVRPVGFQGDNEKKFADAAVFFKKFNDEAKVLEADIKQRKEGDGKKLEEEAKLAKTTSDKLTGELAKLEKAGGAAEEIVAKRRELDAAKEILARNEAYRQETANLDKRAKMLPEIARRLLQGECRLLPGGSPAKVSSTLGTRESKTARLLGESEPIALSDESDSRQRVVDWMRKPDNPYFARAIVNRVWAHYFGRGIIDPPDNLSAFNPPSHPELLNELCRGFIENKFDLRWLHRTILNSRTYQQSSLLAAGAEGDRTHYAYFAPRRLVAEVLLDTLNTATGTTENMDMKYHHWPESVTTVQVPFAPRNAFVTFVLETYGRPQRNAAVQCDCEREWDVSIFHVLLLANHPRVWEKIRDSNGRVAQLQKLTIDDDRKIEDLYLATVSRLPTELERTACRKFLAESATVEQGLQNVLWCLINTREFLLQH